VRSPPGQCLHVAIGLGLLLAAALLFGGSAAHADPPKKKPPQESDNSRDKRAVGGGSDGSAGRGGTGTSPPKDKKEKTYTFGGLDIDGKLKTPQLLYFLNRMKSEFDTTTPDKRSFIPELKRTTEEM
jgi:hypothetical protein